jgi:uncharacterized protein
MELHRSGAACRFGLATWGDDLRSAALNSDLNADSTPDLADLRGRFVWYELTTTDTEAAKAFYAKVVGWGTQDASAPGMSYTLFLCGQTSVGGLMGLPADAGKIGATPRWVGYVAVDDVDATARRVKELGGAVYVPPTDIPNVSRFSVVADPELAIFVVVKWLRPRRDRPAALGEPGRVGWHELLAADREKAFSFYAELFGWQRAGVATNLAEPSQLFSVGGVTIGGVSAKAPALPIPFWLYYFNVDDIDAAEKRVRAAGGEITSGPARVPDGSWMVTCTDPQGAMFALVGGRKAVGYFVDASDPGKERSKRWSW